MPAAGSASVRRVASYAAPVLLALSLAGCGGSAGTVTEATASTATAPTASVAPADSASPAEPSPAETASGSTASTSGSAAGSSLPPVDPCALLDPADIEKVLGVSVEAGTPAKEEAREVLMCTWQRTDPVTVVVTGVTTVGADEAYDTNKELAPAYFDGDPVEKPIAGTDKAYVVKSGDTGYVVGLVANGRYLSVQVAADGVTEAQAIALAQQAATRL